MNDSTCSNNIRHKGPGMLMRSCYRNEMMFAEGFLVRSREEIITGRGGEAESFDGKG